MTEKWEKPLSPAMRNALQAVARMKGDSAIALVTEQADTAPAGPPEGVMPSQDEQPACAGNREGQENVAVSIPEGVVV